MPPPRIFVSHSHHDNAWCRPFVTALQSAGWDAWYDEKGLQAAAAWVKVIQTELQTREIFLLIFTPNAWASEWVQDEIQLALATHRLIVVVEHQPATVDGFVLTLQWVRVPGLNAAAAARQVATELASIAGTSKSPPPDPPPTPQPSPAPEPQRSPTPSAPIANPTLSRRALLATGAAGATVAVLGGGFYWFTHLLASHSQAYTPTNTPGPLVPVSLQTLGFVVKAYGSVKVIIPPTVNVPAGPFLMGSDPAKDPKADIIEEPQSLITIAQAYQIGQYHVTVAEYALAVQASAVRQPHDTDIHGNGNSIAWQAQLNTPDHPVVNVTWTDAVQYAAWLAKITGDPWRLPTEAEWEKAARGTDGRIYPWGNQWDSAKANTEEGGKGTMTPVGAYAAAGDASPYGAHDMAGNVWQWCSTIFQPYPYNANDGRENMSDTTSARVLRGGSWINVSSTAHAGFRDGSNPGDLGNRYIGFRLARVSVLGSR